jgi:hypothetical protein
MQRQAARHATRLASPFGRTPITQPYLLALHPRASVTPSTHRHLTHASTPSSSATPVATAESSASPSAASNAPVDPALAVSPPALFVTTRHVITGRVITKDIGLVAASAFRSRNLFIDVWVALTRVFGGTRAHRGGWRRNECRMGSAVWQDESDARVFTFGSLPCVPDHRLQVKLRTTPSC